MNGELKRFLTKINYENIDIFNSAKVLKVTVNSSKDTMTVYIENEVPIESEYIDKLFDCVSNGIDGVTKLVVKISYNNITNNDVLNCFKYLFNRILISHPSLEGIKEEDIAINNNIINIDVTSKLEVLNIKEEKEKLIKSLKHFGFDNISIDIKINEEKKKNVIKEIEITKEIPIIRNKKENTKKIDSNILYGREIKGNTTIINDIVDEMKDVIVEAFVFGIDTRENEKLDIITLKLSDKTNSLTAKFKIWKNNHEEYEKLKNNIKENNWYKIKGNIENDPFQKDIVLFIKDMESIDSKEEKVKDDEEEKRIELHAHTMYSQMDAVISPGKLLKQAKSFGHKAIAITDHNCLQAYPDLYNDYNSKGEDKVKVIYGAELNVINNELDIVINKKNYNLLTDTYVVFDTETTGFNAGGEDSLIEIGAVKICNGEVIDRFDELINPGRTLPKKIIELTGITDELLKDKDNEENSMKRFIEYIGDLPLVAHNAKFDFSFIDMAFKKYNLGEFKNTILDTMELSAPGTLISAQTQSDDQIVAIAAKDGITAIRINSSRMLLAYGFLRRVFEVFERYKTPIDMITTSEVAVSLTIDDTTNLEKIVKELENFGTVELDYDQAIVCIVGDFKRNTHGHATIVSEAVKHIPIRMISYGGSEHNISMLVPANYKVEALRSLHNRLF